MNLTERAPLELLIRGFGVRAFEGSTPAFGSPDLGAQLYGVLCAYDKGWAGARPASIDQAAHAPPDMPLRELGRVRPPVRDILGCGPPYLRWLFSLHCTLPASLIGSRGRV
jgi:hypothetical protein